MGFAWAYSKVGHVQPALFAAAAACVWFRGGEMSLSAEKRSGPSAADEVEKEHLERILPQLLLDLGP